MLNNQTVQTLRSLKLTGMAEGLEQQQAQPSTHEELGFDERLALLVDREATYRSNNKVTRLLKMAKLKLQVYPEDIDWHGEVEVIYQNIENLHACIKGPCGDWYFTGDYPTPGGFATVNLAYVKWFEGADGRSYDLPL